MFHRDGRDEVDLTGETRGLNRKRSEVVSELLLIKDLNNSTEEIDNDFELDQNSHENTASLAAPDEVNNGDLTGETRGHKIKRSEVVSEGLLIEHLNKMFRRGEQIDSVPELEQNSQEITGSLEGPDEDNNGQRSEVVSELLLSKNLSNGTEQIDSEFELDQVDFQKSTGPDEINDGNSTEEIRGHKIKRSEVVSELLLVKHLNKMFHRSEQIDGAFEVDQGFKEINGSLDVEVEVDDGDLTGETREHKREHSEVVSELLPIKNVNYSTEQMDSEFELDQDSEESNGSLDAPGDVNNGDFTGEKREHKRKHSEVVSQLFPIENLKYSTKQVEQIDSEFESDQDSHETIASLDISDDVNNGGLTGGHKIIRSEVGSGLSLNEHLNKMFHRGHQTDSEFKVDQGLNKSTGNLDGPDEVINGDLTHEETKEHKRKHSEAKSELLPFKNLNNISEQGGQQIDSEFDFDQDSQQSTGNLDVQDEGDNEDLTGKTTRHKRRRSEVVSELLLTKNLNNGTEEIDIEFELDQDYEESTDSLDIPDQADYRDLTGETRGHKRKQSEVASELLLIKNFNNSSEQINEQQIYCEFQLDQDSSESNASFDVSDEVDNRDLTGETSQHNRQQLEVTNQNLNNSTEEGEQIDNNLELDQYSQESNDILDALDEVDDGDQTRRHKRKPSEVVTALIPTKNFNNSTNHDEQQRKQFNSEFELDQGSQKSIDAPNDVDNGDLTGETRGHKINQSKVVTELLLIKDLNNSTEQGEQNENNFELDQYSQESAGSLDGPDEVDDGDWNILGEFLQRKFLSV